MLRDLPTRRAVRMLRVAHPNIRREMLRSERLEEDRSIERVTYRGTSGGVAYLVDHVTRSLFQVPAGRSCSMTVRGIRDHSLRPHAPRRRPLAGVRWLPRRPASD